MQAGISIFNPQKNTQETVQTLRRSSIVCQWIVVVTSSVGVFAWAQDLAYKYLPASGVTPFAAFLIAAIFAFCAGYITDIGFGRVLQDVLFRTFASKHPNVRRWNGDPYFSRFQSAETVMKWLLLAMLLTMDVASMYVITDPVTRAAGSDAVVDVEAMRTEMQSKYDAQAASLRTQATEKDAAIKAEQKRVAQSNSALAKLQASGNPWAANKMAKEQARATKSDREAKAKLENAHQATIAEGQQYISARIAEAEQRNRETSERNKANQSTAAIMYLIFTIGIKLLTIFLRVQIVVSFCAYSYSYRPDITGDGVIDYRDAEAYAKGQNDPANFQSARQT
jgi:hypothetical protein